MVVAPAVADLEVARMEVVVRAAEEMVAVVTGEELEADMVEELEVAVTEVEAMAGVMGAGATAEVKEVAG